MSIERCEVSSVIGIVPGSVRKYTGPTGYIGDIVVRSTRVETASSYEIKPVDYTHVTKPRLVLVDIRSLLASKARGPVWFSSIIWDALRYGGLTSNGDELPVMAVVSSQLSAHDYRKPTYFYGWEAVAQSLPVRLRVRHRSEETAGYTVDNFGSAPDSVRCSFYDQTWFRSFGFSGNPFGPVLEHLRFDLTRVDLSSDLSVCDWFANGLVAQGSSNYEEVVVITPAGTRAFSVPPTSDDPHLEPGEQH